MNTPPGTIWPPLESEYEDEFGRIEPEVYRAAGALWNADGERYARAKLGDAPAGLRLMLRAAASVSRRRLDPSVTIESLPDYLFQSFKRLVLAELEKRNGHRRRDAELHAEAASLPDATADDLERKILIQQLMERMDAWTREIFELLLLRYTFEEIGRMRGESGHHIRTRYGKKLKGLKKLLEAESVSADEKRALSKLPGLLF